MYKMKDGILYRDGKPTFGIGVSYYASFHPEKRTIPDDGDKIGEMIKDIHDIAKAGFNHIRTAALGSRHWEGSRYCADTTFPDAMTDEANKNGLAVFMRLNGYSMNQRGIPDAAALNQFGEACAAAFIHDTLNHPELMRDTDQATVQLARHFAEFDNIIGFQLFNEPTIQAWNTDPPFFFDYNPYAIAAFRVWLVEKGYFDCETAKTVEVPTEYPVPAEKKRLFRLFRQFGVENTSSMLCRLNAAVREALPDTLCFTNCVAVPFSSPVSGCEADCFAISDMDMIGFDLYEEVRGMEYYHSMRLLDICENAAFLSGKTAWLPEMCCRTHMRIDDYEREAYAAIGTGYKGITYYLWRADLGGPEIQLGGMIWNDRRKTEKFEEAVKFNAMLEREGEKIVNAQRVRDGAAILYSIHGAAMCEDSDEDGQNKWYRLMYDRYTELMQNGITPVFVPADKLESAPFPIRILFVPTLSVLDAAEKTQVESFARTHLVVLGDNRIHPMCGSEVYGMNAISNWCHKPAGTWQAELYNHRERFLLHELLDASGVRLLFCARAKRQDFALQTLSGQCETGAYYLLSLIHIASDGSTAKEPQIVFDEEITGTITHVRYVDRNGECELPVIRGEKESRICLPDAKDIGGALVYLYY